MKLRKSTIAVLIASGVLITGCSSSEYNGIKYSLKEDKTLIENDNLYLDLYKDNGELMNFLLKNDLLPKTQTQFRLSGPSDKVTVRVSKGTVNNELVYRILNHQIVRDTEDESLENQYYKVSNNKIEKIDLSEVEKLGFDGNEDGKFDDKIYDVAPKAQEENKDESKDNENNVTDNSYNIKHGEFLSSNITEDILVIKTKIEPNLNNKLTISQNEFNVEDIIKNQGGDQFNEIQYWAVADMEDGSESKVISFTLDKNLIDSVKSGNTPANQIIDKSSDVWVLPSLKN